MPEMPAVLSAMVFTHTCTLMPWTAGTVGRDGWAKETFDPDDEVAGVVCFFDDRGAIEIGGGGLGASGARHAIVVDNPLLLLPPGTAVDRKYKVKAIKEGSATIEAGPYEIKSIRFPGGTNHHIECVLERLNAD